ncbi:ATP-dependent DNA ligase [Streptomyces sp. NPDC052020]|uniref:ATP-dependent DNA ligase n=1 Tax=Streptomyces sp. NPDC052020 TaxID=3155677 RepID=UPI00343EDA6A
MLTVPAPGVLPGELRFQPKFNGYRAIVFTPWPAPGPVLVQSRRGSFMQSRFPDLVQAAAHLPDGLVLNGELVVWAGDRMSFEALQRRAVSGGRTAARLAQELPAHFIAFDLLQLDGQELLHVPYGERRTRLERLFTDRGLSAPWTLCPETDDVATAREWLTSWTQVPGVEGLVIRGTQQRYLPGARALYKVRRRDTTEAVIGAITGTVRRPRTLGGRAPRRALATARGPMRRGRRHRGPVAGGRQGAGPLCRSVAQPLSRVAAWAPCRESGPPGDQ